MANLLENGQELATWPGFLNEFPKRAAALFARQVIPSIDAWSEPLNYGSDRLGNRQAATKGLGCDRQFDELTWPKTQIDILNHRRNPSVAVGAADGFRRWFRNT